MAVEIAEIAEIVEIVDDVMTVEIVDDVMTVEIAATVGDVMIAEIAEIVVKEATVQRAIGVILRKWLQPLEPIDLHRSRSHAWRCAWPYSRSDSQ